MTFCGSRWGGPDVVPRWSRGGPEVVPKSSGTLTGQFQFVRHLSAKAILTRLGNFHLCCTSNVFTLRPSNCRVETLEMQYKWNCPNAFFEFSIEDCQPAQPAHPVQLAQLAQPQPAKQPIQPSKPAQGRFDIVISETTKNCPTAVVFSLDIRRLKAHKHVWVNSICVVFRMFRRHNYVDKGRVHVNWSVLIA